MKAASIAGLMLMALGAGLLIHENAVFATEPIAIGVQIAAALLMIYARITFGRRSFHAAANPTQGGIVTTGPYAYVRHPIYAAIIYFTAGAAADHRTWIALACVGAIVIGGVIRMLFEERMLVREYPEYRDYMTRVKRIIPFVL